MNALVNGALWSTTPAEAPRASAPLRSHGSVLAAWAAARHFLIDLDGTLVRGDALADGAIEMLQRLDGRYLVVSNNSTHTAGGLSRALRRRGMQVPPSRIVLAGECAVDHVAATFAGARLRLVGSVALRRYAAARGCQLVDDKPDLVLLARDTRFSFATLTTVSNDLRRGARLVATNADMNHPTRDGHIAPETGALLQAVMACAGVRPDCVVGKPESLLFERALARLGALAASTLMIGDNPDTDGVGAARLGMGFALIGDHPAACAASPAELLARSDRWTPEGERLLGFGSA